LDALMRLLWQRFGKREQPYQLADLQQALAEISADAAFAERFFADSIYAPALPDFAPLFAAQGINLQPARAEQPWLGSLLLNVHGDAVMVDSLPRHGSPWALAGVTKGDLLLKLGNVRLHDPTDVDTVLATVKPGDQLPLLIRRFDAEQTLLLTVGTDPQLKLSLDPKARSSARKARQDWLGAKKI